MKQPTIYEQITQTIIADLEEGVRPWIKPWRADNCATTNGVRKPIRSDGRPFSGINTLILWQAAIQNSFHLPHWLTYKQAEKLGGQVRKGENSQQVMLAISRKKNDEEAEVDHTLSQDRFYTYFKPYSVFNASQVSGLPETFYMEPAAFSRPEISEHVQEFIYSTGAKVCSGGDTACYSVDRDLIQMPESKLFNNMDNYYSTICHELTHWTGHRSRLDRFRKKSTDMELSYAREELIAEIGSAFLCADLGLALRPRRDHAEYIQHWLKLIKSQDKAIFIAASEAQKACNYLHSLQPSQRLDNDLQSRTERQYLEPGM